MVDYFTYQFVKLNDKERKTYMQNSYRFVLDKVANNPEHCELFKDKGKFYKVFSKYVHRAVLSSEEAADENTFFDFCKKHNKIIVKPMDSHRGIGVEIIDVSTEEQIKNAYKKVFDNKMVVEEVLTQNETMAKPHPNSINTLRIATAIDSNGETHIMSVCWRMGYGENCIDNASGGGIFAPVNPETGIVDRCAMDLNAKMYSFHPTSNELLVGIKIPKWEELKKLAVEVTKVVPDMKYIGWDWAMNGNDEWELIEGNNPGGVHMLQLLAGRGLKKDYDGVLLCKK